MTSIPFYFNSIFISYAKVTDNQLAIPIIQDIIAQKAFQENRQSYFEKR